MWKVFVAIAATAALSACAASSQVSRSAPKTAEIENTVVLNEPFETVWDRLIRNLSSDFFVINNVEKASRIMNVSFSASNPMDFIDCGTTHRTFSGGAGGGQTYDYPNAAAFISYRTAWNNQPVQVDAQQALEGRVNIYVAPKDQGTEVVVNARYTLSQTGTITSLHPIYLNPMQSQPLQPATYSLDTKRSVAVPGGGGAPDVNCRARGTLEQRILDAAVQG